MTEAIVTDRVVIVGAGLAALYAALKLAPRPVLMISPEKLGEGASSAWAQQTLGSSSRTNSFFTSAEKDTYHSLLVSRAKLTIRSR